MIDPAPSGSSTPLSAPADFYDALAPGYDAMTRFDERVPREAEALAPLVRAFGIERALDMGCGSGAVAFALARLGVQALGVDVSEAMLAEARAHASAHDAATEGPRPEFIRGDFLHPVPETHEPVHAVFCLGNGLAHVASHDELRDVLAHWRAMLVPGGGVLVQILHYARILRERRRVVAARRAGGVDTVRFYDFTVPRIVFNILTLRGGEGPLHTDLRATELLPVTADELRRAASHAGFTDIRLAPAVGQLPLHPAIGSATPSGAAAEIPFPDDATDVVALLCIPR